MTSSVHQAESHNSGVLVPVDAEGVHEELQSFDHWVVWKAAKKDAGFDKWPYNARTGELASTTDSRTWAPFATAVTTYIRDGYDGVGFVFSTGDPFTGIDLDKCRNPETGAITEWVAEWLDTFDGYTEISPSGEGLHVYIRGKATSRKNAAVEVYSAERFFTVTGVRP